ncbi:glycosyltransferase [Microcoleus sp. FACHB-831]|uniref:glycosyltransferase n=1 Tax=Microcoleus sp. FACHB-831 TaxID=2692827 RepID=UPI0018EFCB21|nr:glycosyltransferase [Microcoleus sp. FACHB-831]
MCISKIASVIVTWNKLHDVCSVIEDIANLELHNIALDIYLVDNASTDSTQSYIEQHYPQVKVLQTGSNLGGSGGFSYGLEIVSQLEYDFFWLLDNDVRLDTLALLPLVETLQNYPEVGLVGSQIRKLDEPNTIQEVGSFINSKKAHLTTNFGNSSITSVEEILAGKPYVSVDACAAASLLVRREIVQQIGVFENYFLHFDDVEWCLRAKQASWVVASNPASIVWHKSPDFKIRPWISYYDERNLCYCWQKHRPNLILKRVFVSLPRLIYYAATGRYFLAQISIRGFQDFVKGVRGKMLEPLYTESSLEEIIMASSTAMVQSTIYKDSEQNSIFKSLEAEQKLTVWFPPNTLLSRLCLWLVACFWKPVDVAIVTYRYPEFYALNLAKHVYFFTGSGYVPASFNPIVLMKEISQTILQMWEVYWQISKFKFSEIPQAISNKLFPLVSIAICTADRHIFLKKALNSLEFINYKKIEVIIIDASSTTETSEMLCTLSSQISCKFKYFKSEPRNISYSRNIGIKLASGSIIAFFDDDAIPPGEWIDKLLITYSVYGDKCAAVGGTVRDLTRPGYPLQFRRGISSVLGETIPIRAADAANYNQPNGFWYNGLMGTNSSYRKDLLEKINCYDEFFDYFLDETDVCLRLIQAGYDIHYADVVVDHYPQPSHNRIDQKHLTCWYSIAKNTTYFALKHGFKVVPFPILVTRLTFLLIYRCLLRILRLKFTHNLPYLILINYIQQAFQGIRVGWAAGMTLHKVNFNRQAC